MNQHLTIIPVFAAFVFYAVAYNCDDAKEGIAKANNLIKDSVFQNALNNITNSFSTNRIEHVVSFGKDIDGHIISSAITVGNATNASVPFINNAFSDLHNHPGNLPPDAGDLYGLIDINQNHPNYNTRFVITPAGNLYALLITDTLAVRIFDKKYPRQKPAYIGVQPAFTETIVDEFREIKYKHNGTDEMALSFILEKYKTGVCLLKQNEDGGFKKLVAVVSGSGDQLKFSINACP